jgi:acyl phosphate:glycerol-3-phosphate acyltransferase
MLWVLGALGAFLLGSLPWGLWMGRLVRRIDVRDFGSGNLGATNVYRTLGPIWGIMVLLLDAAKGVGAVLLTRAIVAHGAGMADPGGANLFGHARLMDWAGLLGSAGAVLGHTFSPLAGFRGGKGVAAAAGAWGVLAPVSLAIALGVWILLFAATRIVSLSSIVAALALVPAVVWAPLTGLVSPRSGGVGRDPIFWFSILTALILSARHRSNLTRLLHRKERPLALRGSASGPRSDSGTGS